MVLLCWLFVCGGGIGDDECWMFCCGVWVW